MSYHRKKLITNSNSDNLSMGISQYLILIKCMNMA